MLRRAVANIQEGFGGVEPEDAQRPAGLVGQQQRDRPVQAEAAVRVVSEGVQVIKTIGFPVPVKATELHNQHPSRALKKKRAGEMSGGRVDLVSLSCRSSACSGTPYT